MARDRGPTPGRGRAGKSTVAIIGTRGYPSYYGGFETLVRKLAPYLVDQGWQVTVYGRAGATRPDDEQRHPGVRTVDTIGRESRSLSTLSYGLSSTLHAAIRRPDVALVMNVANGFWLPLLKMRGIPTVVNVDGIEWERAKWGRLAKGLFRLGARMAARHADVLIYDAQAIERFWQKEFRRDGVVIPYGGDDPGELQLPEGLRPRRYVLVVARFVPENTVPEFLEAAHDLSDVADVVLVGSTGYGGALDDKAAELARDNKRIHWLGHISDDARLFALWQHAGVYFHGQSVGGTNPALVQAMACGAPIVARDTIYNREVLEHTGIFVEATAHAIRDACSALITDPALQEQLSEAALARAENVYPWERICRDYYDVLCQTAGDFADPNEHDQIAHR